MYQITQRLIVGQLVILEIVIHWQQIHGKSMQSCHHQRSFCHLERVITSQFKIAHLNLLILMSTLMVESGRLGLTHYTCIMRLREKLTGCI
uniref:Uncharacterized protein n=1 Tax=uncultured marine group II/III euryarchaeote KM3_87_B04 TaxID=1456530 RepID=A0A075I0J7_9EURY|nr:hypothetical protein [uncultured marine group II/III euryarchaeote KM3_87_B04]